VGWLNTNLLFGQGFASIFAAAPVHRREMAGQNPLLWYLAFALLSIAIAIGVTMAIRVWCEINEAEPPVTNEEILDELRQAYANGEMDEAEFRRVTELLTKPAGPALDETIVGHPSTASRPDAALPEDPEKTQLA